MVEEYIRRGLKIRIINSEENGGPGIARQRVLDTTQCDYIMYLDADDMLMPRAVEVLYTQAKAGNYDIIRSSFIREDGKGQDVILTQNISTVTWFHGKIYKVAFLKGKNIRFLEGLYADEDAYFNLIAWNSAENRGEMNEVTYIWRHNPNSITRNKDDTTYFLSTYMYYIRSQVEGLKGLYRVNGTYAGSLVTQTLLNIYYYYMRACFYKADQTAMNECISSLRSEPWIKEYLKDGNNWKELVTTVKGGAIYEETNIVFYSETVNNWIMRLIADEN